MGELMALKLLLHLHGGQRAIQPRTCQQHLLFSGGFSVCVGSLAFRVKADASGFSGKKVNSRGSQNSLTSVEFAMDIHFVEHTKEHVNTLLTF